MQLSNQGKKTESSQFVDWHQSEPFLEDLGRCVSLPDNPWFNPLRRLAFSTGSSSQEGWIMQRGESPMVRVSPCWIKEANNSLTDNLVFLKHLEHGLSRVHT